MELIGELISLLVALWQMSMPSLLVSLEEAMSNPAS